MQISFPAMEGVIGGRTYYSCLMKLSTVPKMFTFRDWAEFTPEQREQRVLNKRRVPDIARYILENEDGYLFASITASYKCPVQFTPIAPNSSIGELKMEFEEANFVINDGQHRCAGIAAALKENPALAEETISILLFPYENLGRVQQMFSDLNRHVAKTSKSLDILYDKRDQNSRVAITVVEQVPAFKGLVDKDAISLPVRSPKLFTLSSIYDATVELLGEENELTFNEAVTRALEYWAVVSKMIPLWGKVKIGDMKSVDMRQEYICAHSVVLRALGSVGADLFRLYPDGWKEKLIELNTIDWRKVNPDWENVCIVANSVVSNRQARLATKAYLKRKLGLALTEPEKRSLPALPEPAESKDGKLEVAKK
jgi:DNA sulfur modification protein DndB